MPVCAGKVGLSVEGGWRQTCSGIVAIVQRSARDGTMCKSGGGSCRSEENQQEQRAVGDWQQSGADEV